MPHFKDQNGGLFWLDDHDVDGWKGDGWQQIDDAEAEAVRAANEQPVPRSVELLSRLQYLDQESIRPARVVASALADGKPVPAFEADKLATIELEAVAIRAELATLGAA